MISVTYKGRILLVITDNPPVNALSQPVREGIWSTVDAAQTDERADAIVDRKDGKQKIPWFALEWITAPRAAIERHKPIAQGSHLIPWDEDRTDTACWAFPPEGIRHHTAKTFR